MKYFVIYHFFLIIFYKYVIYNITNIYYLYAIYNILYI